MKISDLNNSLLLQEWWAQDVAKSMKNKGTVGAFTAQGQDMGFKKLKGDWLYVDRKKNVYIKQLTSLQTLPNSPSEKVIRYFNLVSFEDTIVPLQNLLHISTFNQVDSLKYEDKNHYYIYNANAKKPPAFICIDKTN